MFFICVLNINPFSDILFENIFLHSVDCLFILLMVSFAVQASLVAQLVKNLPAVPKTWLGSIPELRIFPGEGNGYPLQYSGLENSMDFIVHGVTKSQM